MMLIITISIILLILYAGLITAFTAGLFLQPKKSVSHSPAQPFVSVIVAMRNEAPNLPALLKCLAAQQYPHRQLEIIFSDDFSDDHSAEIALQAWQGTAALKVLKAQAGDLPGKKAAQARAIYAAGGDVLLFTDADCKPSSQWLKTMVAAFDGQTRLVAGPVQISTSKGGVFAAFQALEFMSLQGSTAGAIALGKPIMCNGANLAIRKETWEEINIAMAGKQLASGDDMFLLHALNRKYPRSVRFARLPGAAVETNASATLGEFLRQRIRWAAKSRAYTDGFTLASGAIAAAFNLWLLALLLMSLTGFLPFTYFAALLLTKCVTDAPMLIMLTSHANKRKLLWAYLPLQCLYPIYTATVLLMSVWGVTMWKGRQISARKA